MAWHGFTMVSGMNEIDIWPIARKHAVSSYKLPHGLIVLFRTSLAPSLLYILLMEVHPYGSLRILLRAMVVQGGPREISKCGDPIDTAYAWTIEFGSWFRFLPDFNTLLTRTGQMGRFSTKIASSIWELRLASVGLMCEHQLYTVLKRLVQRLFFNCISQNSESLRQCLCLWGGQSISWL